MRENKDTGRNGTPQKRPNRLTSAEDAEAWRDIVGEQNFQACVRALEDGASIWTFMSVEEIDGCTEIDEEEKKSARNRLEQNSEGSTIPFAGLVKRPLRVEDMSPVERMLNGIKEYPSGSGNSEPSH